MKKEKIISLHNGKIGSLLFVGPGPHNFKTGIYLILGIIFNGNGYPIAYKTDRDFFFFSISWVTQFKNCIRIINDYKRI